MSMPGSAGQKTETRGRAWRVALGLVGVALVVLGAFAPWVPHPTAALSVTGVELAELAKFFPQVQAGAVPVRRALFVTPLVTAAILLGLLLNRRARRRPLGILGTLAGIVLASAALPPYEYLRSPDYRTQLLLASVGIALTVCTLASRWLSDRLKGVLTILLASLGLLLPLWQYRLLRPLIVALYDRPLAPGWGLLCHVAGFGLLIATGGWGMIKPTQARP